MKKVVTLAILVSTILVFAALAPASANQSEKTIFEIGTFTTPNLDYPGFSVYKNEKVIGGDNAAVEYNFDSLGNSWTGTHTNTHWILDLVTFKGACNGYFESPNSWGTYNLRFKGLGSITYYGPDLPIGVNYGETVPGITYEGTAMYHFTDGPFAGKIGLSSVVGVSYPPGSAIGGIYYGTVTILN